VFFSLKWYNISQDPEFGLKTHPLSPSLIKRGGTKGGEFSVIDRSAFGGKEIRWFS